MLKDLSLIIKQTALSIEKFSGSMLYDCIIPEGFKQSVRKIDNSSITYTNHGFIVKSSGLSIYFSNQLWYYAAACTDLYIALSEYDNIIKGSLKIDKEILKSCKDDVHRAESVIPSTYTGQDRNFLVKYLSDYNWWSGGKTVDRNDYYYSPVVSTCKLVNASQSYVAEMTRFLAGKPNERDLLLSIIPQLAKPIKTLIFDKTNVVEFMAYCVKEFLSFDRNMSMVKNFWKINTVTIGFTGCQMGKEKSAQDAVIDQRRLNDCDKSIVWNVDDKQYYFLKEQTTSTLDVFAKQMNSIYENYYCIEITDKYKLYKYALDQQSNANAHFLPNSRIFTPLQTIFYGAPGTGKSHKIDGQTNDNNSIRTTFHPDTDYATFVGAYKPMMDVVDEYALDATGKTHQVVYPNGKKSIVYKFEPQVFLKAYVEAWKRYLNKQEGEDDGYYLVIEEINRGNCAQIFGDLFQLLDREDCGYSSYAISPESAITQYLAVEAQSADGTKFSDFKFSDVTKDREGVTKTIATADELKNGKRLVLPPNLHIWATMNTSDQSLFPIDSAFKRRWDWKYVPIKRADKEPENKWIIKVAHDGKTYWCYWWEFLEAINHQIEETNHSEDKQLGYFFAKPKAGENFISAETFVNKVIFYLWNDVFKDEDSAVFQYDNNKVEDVSINRSGAMYFRHFMENKDEMIHYFINQLFAMGKDSTPVVPIDYLKNDADSKVIEHLPKMREDCEETPMPNLENKDEIKEEEGDEKGKVDYTCSEYAQIFDRVDAELQTVGCERIANAGNSIDYKLKDIPSSICNISARLNKAKNDPYGEVLLWMTTDKTDPQKSKNLRDKIADSTEGVFKTFKNGNVTLRTLEKDPTSIESINRGWVLKNPDIKFTDDSLNDDVKWIYETMKGLLDQLQPIIKVELK